MAGGGKGGSQTTRMQIPQWLENASQSAIQRGEGISQIGYTPYMGPSVAAFTPTQESAFHNTNSAANAFGLNAPTGTGMPQAQDFGGFSGYSAFPMYDQAQQQFRQANPGQADYIDSFFVNPQTGVLGAFK